MSAAAAGRRNGRRTSGDEAEVVVEGGGLAGCEAALQLAERGRRVRLHEMRPSRSTPARRTDLPGELVCTNSFKTEDPTNAHGELKREMELLGSVLLRQARRARVPAGSALAVDRGLFSRGTTAAVEALARIELVRDEVTELPRGPAIIATGPLTSDALSRAIQLRREDQAGQMRNMVGFQTRLRHGERERVFRMIPSLGEAEFLRWGQIHRNSYLNFPARLSLHGSLGDRALEAFRRWMETEGIDGLGRWAGDEMGSPGEPPSGASAGSGGTGRSDPAALGAG